MTMFGADTRRGFLTVVSWVAFCNVAVAAQPGHHVKDNKGKEVDLDVKVNSGKLESVNADSVKIVGGNAVIDKLFLPPAAKKKTWRFKEFTAAQKKWNPFKLDYVDIIVDPLTSSADAKPDSPSRIKVMATIPLASAIPGTYPVKSEGNLEPPRGGGGGGGGAPPKFHWAAKMDAVCEVSLTPVSAGNTPDISPDLCINAQSGYRTARWQATVLPEGATAEPVAQTSATVLDG